MLKSFHYPIIPLFQYSIIPFYNLPNSDYCLLFLQSAQRL